MDIEFRLNGGKTFKMTYQEAELLYMDLKRLFDKNSFVTLPQPTKVHNGDDAWPEVKPPFVWYSTESGYNNG